MKANPAKQLNQTENDSFSSTITRLEAKAAASLNHPIILFIYPTQLLAGF